MSCIRLQRTWHIGCKMIKCISNITLASGSPRRIKMLQDLGVQVRVMRPDVEEDVILSLSPGQLVMFLALKKALSVETELLKNGETLKDSLLIAADTIVYAQNVVGKPENEEDAFRILSSLRGKTHTVSETAQATCVSQVCASAGVSTKARPSASLAWIAPWPDSIFSPGAKCQSASTCVGP